MSAWRRCPYTRSPEVLRLRDVVAHHLQQLLAVNSTPCEARCELAAGVDKLAHHRWPAAMRIFLSHASEQHSEADRLAIALRARGHRVFLDRDDLPSGGDYQTRIQAAIDNSDLFCFLVSSSSIATGRFTMSELGMARRRWPNPAGRVLPVLVEKLPLTTLPAYLRSVSVLEPQGDLVADALVSIDAMRPRWTPARRGLAVAAVGLLGAGLLLAAYQGYRHVREPTGGPAGNEVSATSATEATIAGSGAGAGMTLQIPASERMKSTVEAFVPYMRKLGFGGFNENVTVYLFSKDSPLPSDLHQDSSFVNAFYRGGVLYIHWSMAGDRSVLLREYSHHILLSQAPANSPQSQIELESALADYFPASHLGGPLIGSELGSLFQLPTPYIRTLDNNKTYASHPDLPQMGGEVWAAALWSCRQKVGQSAIDAAAAQAWLAVRDRTEPAPEMTRLFGKALSSASEPAGGCLSQELQRRRLPR